MPSNSIIVPIFNGIHYIQQFIHSLAIALPPNTELIFVDDGSTEPVLEAIPSDLAGAKLTKLRNEKNLGYSCAVNRGFAHATGDIVFQLNTDLILRPNSIEAIVDFIDETKNVGIVGSKQVFPTNGLLRHIGMAFGTYRHRHIYSGFLADHPLACRTRSMQIVSGAAVAMTRQVLEDIGPLNEQYFNTHENFDHCMVAIKKGYENYTCSDSMVYHWVGQSGPSRYSRVLEGDSLFWSKWTPERVVDLGSFIDEALDYLLDNNPQLSNYPFEALCLSRSADQSVILDCLGRRWPSVAQHQHDTSILNYSPEKIWLPMLLPHRAISHPKPYVYIVDRVKHLAENRYWFEHRDRLIESEIVVDARATVMTSQELLTLYR